MLALFVKISTMYSVFERSAVFFSRIPNILRITVRYSASHVSAGYAYTRVLARQPYWKLSVINQRRELDNGYGKLYLYISTQAYVNLRKIYKS